MADFTKRAINDTFRKMLKTQKVGPITVKSITDACEISRNTFYYHYDSLTALLHAELEMWFTSCTGNASSLAECMEPFIAASMAHKAEIIRISSSGLDPVFCRFLGMRIHEAITVFLQKRLDAFETPPTEEKKAKYAILALFCTSTITYSFIGWIHRGMGYDIKAFITTLDALTKTGKLPSLSSEQIKSISEELKRGLPL